GDTLADTEVGMPAEEAGGGSVAAVAHARLESQARGIEGEAHAEVDGEGIARNPTHGCTQPRAGAAGARNELRHFKLGIAHEAVAGLPLPGGGSGLQVVLDALEAVARIGDAARERHHDGEA